MRAVVSHLVCDDASCGVHINHDNQAMVCRKETTELIGMLKVSLMGDDPPAQPPSAQDVNAYIQALLATDVLFHMVACLSRLHFETRKEVVAVFSFVTKYRPASQDGSSANGSVHGAPTQGMPSRNGARSSSVADLASVVGKASTDTPGLEHVRDHPALLEKLCACDTTHTPLLMNARGQHRRIPELF